MTHPQKNAVPRVHAGPDCKRISAEWQFSEGFVVVLRVHCIKLCAGFAY